jgi:hypothetical protein
VKHTTAKIILFALLMSYGIEGSAQTPPAFPIASWPSNGAQSSERPVLKWAPVIGAAQYNLQVFDEHDNMLLYHWYYPSEAGCAGLETRCTVVMPIELGLGTYRWLLRSWNPTGGYSGLGPLRTFTVADTRAARYLSRLQARQTPLVATTARQEAIMDWVTQRLGIARESVTRELFGHLLSVAFKRMNLAATQHVDELALAEGYSFLNVVLDNSAVPLWANCGDSVTFMLEALAAFNIPARQIGLWSTLDDGHSAVEYYSEAFGKFVYFDPLYGVVLVDDSGEPASLEDVMDQIVRFGFAAGAYERWELRPVRFSDASSTAVSIAADSRYDYFNQADYGYLIIRSYMVIIARRFTDLTTLNLTLPGSDIVMGRWLLFDNSVLSLDEAYYSGTFWPAFMQRYSVAHGGRYEMTIVRTVH